MKATWNKKLVASVTVCGLLLFFSSASFAQTASPTPTTGDYNKYCSTAATAAVATASSDQTKQYCQQAKDGVTSAKFALTKEIIMMAATAAILAEAAVEWGDPKDSLCSTTDYVATGVGLGIDMADAMAVSDKTSAMTGMITDMGVAVGMAVGKNAVKGALKTCLVDAAGTAIEGMQAVMAKMSADKSIETALTQVQSLEDARATSGFNMGVGAQAAAPAATGNAANAKAAVSSAACPAGSTDPSCTKAEVDPVAAAITANQGAANVAQNALGDKSLADLANNYSGDGSPASVAAAVGDAMGLSTGLKDALKKTLDDANAIAGDYKQTGYIAAAAPVTAAAPDLDFGKMMSGLMNKMNPEAKKKGEDPSTIVFRQLDLLPPSKIEANKDISLFARIGYRYRKQSGDLEQLNWAVPSNQTVNNTALDSTRTPASKN